MKTAIKDGTQTLSLIGSLEIYDVDEVRQTIMNHLAVVKELVLDLSAVESCDAAGAQLLCSAQKSAVQAGKAFRFGPISSGLTECWTGLGFSPDFFKNSKF